MISTQTEQTLPTALTSQTIQAVQDQQRIARHRDDDPTSPRGRIDVNFGDLLDLINPLQHVPVVGDLYRMMTGDEIKDPIKIMGAGLFGGPLGLVSSVAQTVWRDLRGEGEVGEDGEATALADAYGASDTQSVPETNYTPFEMAHAANAIGHSVAQAQNPAAAPYASTQAARQTATSAQGPLTGLAALAAFSRDVNGIGGEGSTDLGASTITVTDMVPSGASSLMMAQLAAAQPPLPEDKRHQRRPSGTIDTGAGTGPQAQQPRSQTPASTVAGALPVTISATALGKSSTSTAKEPPPNDFLKRMEAGLERYQAMLALRDGIKPMPGTAYGTLM